ncbi:MAG: aminodeoxychorismate synthase component I [Novosphingobium sp.]
MPFPFILLDDARAEGASDARLYRNPIEIVVARRPGEVEPALARIEQLHRQGHHLAGTLAYEAGLVLEPRLEGLATARAGAAGPLVWFGAFAGYQSIPAPNVPAWLAGEAASSAAAIGPLDPQLSPGDYAAAFATLQAAIRDGDIYQANLTFPLAGSWRGDPLALYAAVRPAAGAGYGGIVHDGVHWLLSFSPELFFALKGSAAMARPMKGTRPRGHGEAEDAALAEELAGSVKDRAENLMIVDLLRNDFSRVAEPGSVRVESAFAIESYPTVHQMVSTVRARLRPGLGAIDCLRALFPCGSITGAPKIRAMELIAEVEPDARGAYCGTIGRIDPPDTGTDGTGDAAFNVAIRTLRLVPGENGGGRAILGVGSAIVADSDAPSEWRECLVKGGFVRESNVPGAAARFDLIETMAFTPGPGIALLDLHLDRAEASAKALGFGFDREVVAMAIEAFCRDTRAPAKLRLVLARSGAYSLELAAMPPPLADPAFCALLPLPVDAGDWRLRHKTSDRVFYADALALARGAGAAEALFVRDDGLITEGSFTSIFVEREGHLLTPPARLGLLPGVLRRALLDAGRTVEEELTIDDLIEGFLIGNALRGLMRAQLAP